MSETLADAQFDMLEAAYDEVPIWAKSRIAELTVERDAYFEMVKRVQADCDACDELIRDMWKCLSAHIESAINDGGIGYDYKPQVRGCGAGCTVNGEDCSISLIERRMRRLGIEVDE